MTKIAGSDLDQTRLPGGTIGQPRAFADRTTTWTRTKESGPSHVHVVDRKLERTSLRWSDGWYLVTSAPNESTATWRRGPFEECATAEDALLDLACGINDGPTAAKPDPMANRTPRTDGQSPDSVEDDLETLDHLDLPNSTYKRVTQICNEGHAKHFYDACSRWITEVERQRRADGGPTNPEIAAHCENIGLGASGINSPAAARQAHNDMLAAARSYDAWLEG